MSGVYKGCEHFDPKVGLPFQAKRVMLEQKFDGWWVSLVVDGDKFQVWTRTDTRRPTLEQELEGVTPPALMRDVALVGEADYGTQRGAAFYEQRGYVQFNVFDVLPLPGRPGSAVLERATIRQRKELLQDCVKLLGSKKIVEAPSLITRSDRISEEFKRVEAQGFEGIVVKELDVPLVNERWLKWKHEQTHDFVLMAFEESDSSWKAIKMTDIPPGGVIRAMVCGLFRNGLLEPVVSVGSMPWQLRVDMSRHPEQYLGRVVEVKGFDKFRSGAMRHPSFVRFREDKDVMECVL